MPGTGRTSPAWFSQERESSERQSPSRHKQLDPTDNPSGPDNRSDRLSSEWRAGAVPLTRNVKSHEARVVDDRPLRAKSGHSITTHYANLPRLHPLGRAPERLQTRLLNVYGSVFKFY